MNYVIITRVSVNGCIAGHIMIIILYMYTGKNTPTLYVCLKHFEILNIRVLYICISSNSE